MRIKNLICSEFRFLLKYGIIALYGIFTAVYLCLIAAIPHSVKEITAAILVFTDPAAMGLFFMGAIVLLEKSQRVESSLCVSPIKISEYIFAKIMPLMVVGTVVSLIICLFAGMKNVPIILIGVALSSILFSMCGLFVGSKIQTLNSFLIATVPLEMILFLPAILYLFGFLKSEFWIIHPGVAAIKLIYGHDKYWYMAFLLLIIWLIPAYIMCKKAVAKSFSMMGGAKL